MRKVNRIGHAALLAGFLVIALWGAVEIRSTRDFRWCWLCRWAGCPCEDLAVPASYSSKKGYDY